jgi:hypothetical protein
MNNSVAAEMLTHRAGRAALVAGGDPGVAATLAEALGLYGRSLPRMERPDGRYAFTLTESRRGSGAPQALGRSLRYDAIVTLGALARTAPAPALPRGLTPVEYCAELVRDAAGADVNTGDIALVAWAAAEAGLATADGLVQRAVRRLDGQPAASTVEASWVLRSTCAVGDRGSAERVMKRLMSAARPSSLFAHALGDGGPGWRRHVGCFADQVYPIQALAAVAQTFGRDDALTTANATATRICDLQGDEGQWWWHYDARHGGVVERYPVYSVHQISMAPMALLALREAGGKDFVPQIRRGLAWQAQPTEAAGLRLLDADAGMVWRSVRRQEPVIKAVRTVRALATSVAPTARLRALDGLFPARVIDRECRPYEAGWAFFTWPDLVVDAAAQSPTWPV